LNYLPKKEKELDMKKIVLASILAALALNANAEVFDSTSGWTAGVTLDLGLMGVTGGTGTLDTKVGYGINMIGGYNINESVAIEINAGAFMGPKSGAWDIRSSNVTVDVIGYYPMDDYHLYGLLGYGTLSTSQTNVVIGTASASKSGIRIGGGIELGRKQKKKNEPSLRLGIESYDTGITRTTQIVVGPIWKW